eukprot:CAMPEP_0119527800 /NCGR_PEP_ID=MMETSP1344-20130328/42132_1 /TAXON_ID=236787 /ORGANISM="Florenciella parvula, Strain CCMP2471" /LENGTH=408 /DNA_ID=CAMNT_0007567053 /DNA_START=6 /DNA_END=1229 /DNA_ORIENTATION=+
MSPTLLVLPLLLASARGLALRPPMSRTFVSSPTRVAVPRLHRGRGSVARAQLSRDDNGMERIADPDSQGRGAATLTRVVLPTVVAFVVGALLFAPSSLLIKSFLDQGQLSILGNDSSQFMQNFLTVNGLLFSILAGNTFIFLYQQTEAIYYALFAEVSEAKSLLEQTTLVCQGRPFYQDVLRNINLYVTQDLRRLDLPPAVLLSNKPSNDPLETILYMTSVGVPSVVYETVKSLRSARGYRLGATQRKLPEIHFYLLYFLGFVELLGFPILGAGTSSLFTNSILTVESILFGFMAAAMTMTVRVCRELWSPIGGAYNVDGVLSTMVEGLESELNSRMKGGTFSEDMLPSPPPNFSTLPPVDMPRDTAVPSTSIAVSQQAPVAVVPAAVKAPRRGIRGLLGRAKRTSRD